MISRSCSRERTFRDDGQAPGVRQLGAKGVGGPRPHDGIVRQSSDDRPSSSDLASPTMTVPRKKLIEVALPLEAINKASARESFIYRGNPSAIHKWWAQRPLAAARAVIFSQMVDDPSSYVDVLRTDSKLKRRAEAALRARLKLWEEARSLAARGKEAGLP